MPPKWVGDRNRWVVEVIGLVVAHPEFLHDPAGASVDRRGERNDLEERQSVEAVRQHAARSFWRVPATPEHTVEPPSNFDRRSEVRVERSRPQPDESSEHSRVERLDSPEPEAMTVEVLLDAFDERIALARRQNSREELHDRRIRVHHRERGAIRSFPTPQLKPFGSELARTHQNDHAMTEKRRPDGYTR